MDEIRRILNEFEKYIDRGKTGFSGKKVTFVKDDLLDYLDRLNQNLPEQIKMAKRIVEMEEAIISKAKENASQIVENARAEADKIIDESNLIHEAYERADGIIHEAEEQANRILLSANNDAIDIRKGSLSYAGDMLAEIQKICQYSLSNSEKVYTSIMDAMKESVDDLVHNRMLVLKELGEMDEPREEASSEEEFLVNVSPEDFLEEDASPEYPESDE